MRESPRRPIKTLAAPAVRCLIGEPMDQLDREIEDKRRRRDEAKRLYEQLELEVTVLEHAAKLRPMIQITANVPPSPPSARRGGKPAGSISMAWRRVLAYLYLMDEPTKPDDFLTIATGFGIETSIGSVRDRLRVFEQHGYIKGDMQNGFVVTDAARERLGLDKLQPASTSKEAEAG